MPAALGDGWLRGRFGSEVTVEMGLQLGKLAGSRYKGPVAVASDTRPSGQALVSAVKAGIMASGHDVIDMGQLPTSALQYYIKNHDEVAGGIMVTASHSPMDYNGLKFIAASGRDDPALEGMTVESIMSEVLPTAPWTEIGEIRGVNSELEQYVGAIVENVDSEAIRSKHLKVCVDCARGNCMTTVQMLLGMLDVEYVTMDGNASAAATRRDSELTPENLKPLGNLTSHTKSNFGVAFDTDADRCLFVTGKGKFVNGDKSLCILAKTALDRKKGKVVTTVASPGTVEKFVEENGGLTKYCAVGAPTVVRKVADYGAVFGGEVNGGYVFPDFQNCRDAILSLARMLEAVALNGTLEKLASQIPDSNYVMKVVPCPDERRSEVMSKIKAKLSSMNPDVTDGFKVVEDDGWFLIRLSDTCHVVRVYAEYDDAEKSEAKATEYAEMVRELIGA